MKRVICLFYVGLTSCSIYQSSFDCPPGKGIGCKSVHEVLDLIVEREGQEDLFLPNGVDRKPLKTNEKKQRQAHPRTKLFLLKEHSGDPVLIETTV